VELSENINETKQFTVQIPTDRAGPFTAQLQYNGWPDDCINSSQVTFDTTCQ